MKEKIKELIKLLNEKNKEYDNGASSISDKEYDNLYFKLVELEKESGIYFPCSPTQKIIYSVVSELKKVKHNHPMLSLDKTKNLQEFIGYFNASKDVVGMLKLDGLTCSLRYLDGKLVSAETRGNGEIGEDILHNARVIPSVPKHISYKDELILDGEIICTEENFKEFSEEYSNSRNFASGSIRLLDSKECSKRNLTFVVWNIIKGLSGNSFMNKLQQAEREGFKIVPWTPSLDWDWAEFLQNKAKELGYPIDGLVGRYDDIEYGESLGSTGHHSKAAYAFKFYDEEYETHLLDIEWTMGRTGVLTPVAIFEPVDDGESIIERASLHNISIMKQLLDKPFFNQEIKVIKANQIIPQIVWGGDGDGTHFKIPDTCPICGSPTKIVTSDSGVENLICANPQCEGLLINRLDHFCGKKGLDIKGLSKATLEKLIDWGWVNNLEDIFNLKNFEKEWSTTRAGFGTKSVNNILTSIKTAKNCSLENFISSLGIPLIGKTVSKELIKYFASWEEFREAIDDKNFYFYDLDGFGPEMNRSLKKFDYQEADKIAKLLNFQTNNSNTTTSNSLEGKVFVITGKLKQFKNRNQLVAEIESLGGKVASSITSKTNYLINNDINSTSSKNVSAKQKGIPIITEEDFIAMI